MILDLITILESVCILYIDSIVTGVDTVNSELWFEMADSRRTTRNNAVRHNLGAKVPP